MLLLLLLLLLDWRATVRVRVDVLLLLMRVRWVVILRLTHWRTGSVLVRVRVGPGLVMVRRRGRRRSVVDLLLRMHLMRLVGMRMGLLSLDEVMVVMSVDGHRSGLHHALRRRLLIWAWRLLTCRRAELQ